MGVSEKHIQAALTGFAGIGRRFQVTECSLQDKQFLLVDDYGHHPREVAATLTAVCEGWPARRVVLVFQPHRYSRTRDSFEDFVQVLSETDVLILTEVYAAGEKPLAEANGRALSRAVRARGQVDPVFISNLQELPDLLPGVLQEGDILLLMGAGDIGVMAAQLSGGMGK